MGYSVGMAIKPGDKMALPHPTTGEEQDGTVLMVIPRKDDSLVYRVVFDDGTEVLAGELSNEPDEPKEAIDESRGNCGGCGVDIELDDEFCEDCEKENEQE